MRYEIKGDNLPIVICYLQNGESVVSESGAMSWCTEDIQVETKGRGGLGKMLGRALSGENMFQNIYTGHGPNSHIAFASSFPGAILPVQISSNQDLIVQKRSFMASEVGVQTEIYFQKKIGAGLFGGEGFIMQRLKGNGLAFLEVDGSLHEYDLEAGQTIVIDTGYLVAMSGSCKMDLRSAGNLTSKFFGGEGWFNTVVTGPGKVYLQSMPLSHLISLMPFNTGNN